MIARLGSLLFLLCFLSSCGALKINPRGCFTDGVWGAKSENEISFTKSYYVWIDDYELRLRDFFKEQKIDCRDIKKIHVNIKTVFFVKRDLTITVPK